MNVERHAEDAISKIAAAIGEPARARILYCLMDRHARTSTELSAVAKVSPSTASVHLNRLKTARLVKVFVQGKHRFYSLEGPDVASALEGLSVLAGSPRNKFVPTTPSRLRAARTCCGDCRRRRCIPPRPLHDIEVAVSRRQERR
jgi:DNA-binding transcriptional ArsR family regulator